MGLIKEPLEVDFEVDPRPLTKREQKLISEYIRKDKARRTKKSSKRRAAVRKK